MDERSVKLSKRSGTDDLGKVYEVKVAALLALRCIENHKIKHAWFASNVNHACDFDDVIFYVTDDGDVSTAYLMQLKHQDDPKNLPRKDFLYDAKVKKKSNMTEDFSLHKYLRSYLNIKESLEGAVEDGLVESLRKADEIVYALYTNRPLGAVYEFLCVCEDELGLLDTGGKIYGFDPKKLTFDDHFLRQLKLFTEQAHVATIDELMKKELRRIADAVNIKQLDANNALKICLEFVQTCLKGAKNSSFDALTKTDVTARLTNFILEDYRVRFPLNSPNLTEFSVWSQIIEGKGLVVVAATDDFLKSYVSTKVAEHCVLDNWNQELSKEKFYKKVPDLRPILLKTVGERGLTPSSVYEALALQKKVPLLLQAKTSKEFIRIEGALRLMQIPVIVLTDVIVPPASKCVLDLNHLDEEYQSLILKHPISVQGRPGPTLEDVISKSMYNLVKCKDIIDIISKRFNIGATYVTALQFYVPRAVSKVLLTSQAVNNSASKFLLRGIDQRTFDKISANAVRSESTIVFESDSSTFKDYHDLNFLEEDLFELNASYASTRSLRQYQVVQPQTLDRFACWWQRGDYIWTSIEELYEQSPCVINANPGMGKTELLNHVALHAPATLWVLKVNLNEHHDYYKSIKDANKTALDHLKHFFAHHSRAEELTEKVFLKFVRQKKVLVLLDGFDEVSMTYKEDATSIATSLHQSGFKLWVSTRPVTQAHLEEALDTISRTLKPLVIDDQRNFLTRYFGHLAKDEAQLRTVTEFVDKLLAAAAANLNDSDHRFTGLPLQTKLLADVFEKDLERILQTNEFAFNDKFDLIFLYESFLEEKTNIFCRKFGDVYRDMRKFFKNLQQAYALEHVFPDEKLLAENVRYEDDRQMMHFLQREGVVVIQHLDTNSEETFDVNFVHRTFAEFLAAKWLYRNRNKEEVRHLMTYRFEDGNEFLFGVFDRYAARDLPLHLSIVNRNKSAALDLIALDQASITRLDGCGRTIFHLLACYGLKHPSNSTYDTVGIDEMVEVLDAIPATTLINTTDRLLGYNCLEYAISHKTWAIADKLCQRSKELSFSTHLQEKNFVFYYCECYGYRHLFLLVLKHFVRNDLLQKLVRPDTFIISYCHSLTNLIQYTREYNAETVSELVRGGNDVGFVSAFGSEAELLGLLGEGVDVNATDWYSRTALHYACYHNRLENATLLISRRANANSLDAHGNTALHLTQLDKIVSLLSSAGVDLNSRNKQSKTPLHLAFENQNLDVVHALIDGGADVNLSDDLGMTAFLHACELNKVELVQKMLPMITDINHRTQWNQSALMKIFLSDWYTEENFKVKTQIVGLLLKNDIDVNLQDRYGDTALHVACNINNHMRRADVDVPQVRAFLKSVASLLIRAPKIDLDLKNVCGETAFDVALHNGNIDWNVFEEIDPTSALKLVMSSCADPLGFVSRFGAETDLLRVLEEGVDANGTGLYYALVHERPENAALLIAHKADVNLLDEFGNGLLHVAAESCVPLLASAGADLNHQNQRGESALHAAFRRRNFDVTRALLDEGAELNLADASGMTALHHACEFARLDLVERMLPLVSDLDAQTTERQSALHVLVSRMGERHTEDFFTDKLQILKLLVKNGIDVTVRDRCGDTAFQIVCRCRESIEDLSDDVTATLKEFYTSSSFILVGDGKRHGTVNFLNIN